MTDIYSQQLSPILRISLHSIDSIYLWYARGNSWLQIVDTQDLGARYIGGRIAQSSLRITSCDLHSANHKTVHGICSAWESLINFLARSSRISECDSGLHRKLHILSFQFCTWIIDNNNWCGHEYFDRRSVQCALLHLLVQLLICTCLWSIFLNLVYLWALSILSTYWQVTSSNIVLLINPSTPNCFLRVTNYQVHGRSYYGVIIGRKPWIIRKSLRTKELSG